MNTMTGIQRAAMAQARDGNWALADAIELMHYLAADASVVCGIANGDRLRYIVRCDAGVTIDAGGKCHPCNATGKDQDGACEHCGGRGYVASDPDHWTEECGGCGGCGGSEGHDCSVCEGDGCIGLSDEVFAEIHAVDLNGGAVDDSVWLSGNTLCRAWAERVIANYHASLATPPEQSALELRAA